MIQLYNNFDKITGCRIVDGYLVLNEALGRGIRDCLGAPLARIRTRIALMALFERNPNLRLAVRLEELALRERSG